jgi:hypothetical protein
MRRRCGLLRHIACVMLALIVSVVSDRVASAGLAPEHVLLVVNGDSPSSLTIANEFAQLRQIPGENIVTLMGVSNVEQLPVDEFRRQILEPVLKAIDDRGLKPQIRCVAYSADLPTAIAINADVGRQQLPQVLTPVASINGLTFLHQFTMARDIRYLDLNINTYARRFGTRSADTPWNPEDLKRYGECIQRLQLDARRPRGGSADQPADALDPANDRLLIEALETLVELGQAHPKSSELLYNLACAQATMDRTAEAIQTLKLAVAAGWFDHRHSSRDPDLKSLQEKSEFKQLLDEMKNVKLEVLPTRGFRSDVGWLPTGDTSPRPELPRFLLSTVLAVTAGRGTTTQEAVANLRRSAAADGTRPGGTIYFVKNGDVRSTTREWGFASAVDKLKSMGVDAAIEEGILPSKKDQVAGAMIGIADFNWPASGSTIVPGAIVEHLTSFGGVMTRGAGQTPLTEFLRHGAAGSSGTVTEPYAIQAKFPSPFIHVHYASGTSLAEAFYLSVTGPYQLLVVGDPLCTPWRRDLKLTPEISPPDGKWQGTVTLKFTAEPAGDVKVAQYELYVDGKRMPSPAPDTPLTIDTTKLADGEHQVAVLGLGNDGVESVGRWTVSASVQNSESRPEPSISTTAAASHPFEKSFEVKSECPGATGIAVYHLGRIVARIEGTSGTASLEPLAIGSGPVTLRPVATLADGSTSRGKPVTVAIQLPHD